MSNTEPVTPVTTTAAPPPNVTAAPAAPAPQTPADYQALYEAEQRKNADLVQQRNFLKPAERLLAGLDQNARDALMELGELVRAGDPQAIAEWNLQVAQQVTGKDMATMIAERQAAEQAANVGVVTPVPGLSAAEVAKMVTDALAQDRASQQGQARVAAEMERAGYRHDSAIGETIIRHAVQNNIDLPDAIDWYENEVASTAMERARAAAAAGATVPQGAPQGSPLGTAPDGKKAGESDEEFRRRSIMSRLTNNPTN